MALNTAPFRCKKYDFLSDGDTGEFTAATNGTGAVDLSGQGPVVLSIAASADRSYLHFGDNLVFPIDDLIRVSYLYKVSSWNANAELLLGVASAFNADPDAIVDGCWIKILGATAAVVVETDDGTTNTDDLATGVTVTEDVWNKVVFDFHSGIQSISPPSKSKGGKASIGVIHSNSLGYMDHLDFSQHLDMSAYSGNLQLLFGGRQLSGSGTTTLSVQEIQVEFKQVA